MKHNRPLSPHLTVYKPQLTSSLSIFHRITGGVLALSVCLLIFIGKIFTFNVEVYSLFNLAHHINTVSSWIILSGLFLLLLSLCYHTFNGIRHLIWDTGNALDIKTVYSSGGLMLVISIFSTFLLWFKFIS